MDELPSLAGAPIPILKAERAQRNVGALTSFDAGRGCPYQCSFCTIINVQGRVSRRRTPGDIEKIIRANAAQGLDGFFITDDNFARNKDWADTRSHHPPARGGGLQDLHHHSGGYARPQDSQLHRQVPAAGRQARLHRDGERQSWGRGPNLSLPGAPPGEAPPRQGGLGATVNRDELGAVSQRHHTGRAEDRRARLVRPGEPA